MALIYIVSLKSISYFGAATEGHATNIWFFKMHHGTNN